MKKILVFFCAIIYPLFAFSQSDSILSKELKEVVINSKKKDKDRFNTFDLTGKKFIVNQSYRMPLYIDSVYSIGVFVPTRLSNNLTIRDIAFPIFRYYTNDTSLELDYYIGVKYASGVDTFYQVGPANIKNNIDEVTVFLNSTLSTSDPFLGFYFFIKRPVTDVKKHSNVNIFFNNKYKSKFTRKINNSNSVEIYDVGQWLKNHMTNATEASHVKSLNWRVKIRYAIQ